MLIEAEKLSSLFICHPSSVYGISPAAITKLVNNGRDVKLSLVCVTFNISFTGRF